MIRIVEKNSDGPPLNIASFHIYPADRDRDIRNAVDLFVKLIGGERDFGAIAYNIDHGGICECDTPQLDSREDSATIMIFDEAYYPGWIGGLG